MAGPRERAAARRRYARGQLLKLLPGKPKREEQEGPPNLEIRSGYRILRCGRGRVCHHVGSTEARARRISATGALRSVEEVVEKPGKPRAGERPYTLRTLAYRSCAYCSKSVL